MKSPRKIHPSRRMTVRSLAVASLVLAGLGSVPQPAQTAPVPGTTVTYTTDGDFDQGTLVDVNHDVVHDQLQLNRTTAFFPFVNIAASARGTIIRIDVNTAQIVGEWFSAPAGLPRNPSRTTVDRLGNVWFGNRDEFRENKGSVGRIGVIVGGTRVNGDGSPNPAGAFLKGPFAYNTCQDRNGDNLIATTRGLGDIRPWTNAGGVDSQGGVATAADECLINYTRVAGTGTRTVAVDANNDLWTGGLDTDHEKVNGVTGQVVPGTVFNQGCGGYGGFIDTNNVLWSARFGNNLLRRNLVTNTGVCLPTDRGDYGLGLDPNTGEVWHTSLSGPSTGNPATSGRVCKLTPAGAVIGCFGHGSPNAQGVAVDRKGNVWVAHSLFGATTVGHLRTDGTYVGNVTLPGGNGPTGVAVDSNGKVWVANINSNNAMRIDPNGGPVGGGGFHVGAVDMTVDLGAGAGPYNYSDMTGSVLGEVTAPFGTWTVVQDGGSAGMPWGTVTWNTEPEGVVPPGTSIVVEARAADTEAGLPGQVFTPVSNGTEFSLTGRFIEVRATLTASPSGDSPVLSDLTIKSANRPPVFDQPPTPECGSTIAANNGETVEFDVQASDPDPGDTVTLDATGVPAGASLTPALPTAGNPVATHFAWVPGPGDEGTTTVTFAATDSRGATATCTITIRVVALLMTGRAYGLSASGLITINPRPDTGEVATKVASTTPPECVSRLGNLTLSAQTLCVNVTTQLLPSRSRATATVERVSIGSLVPGMRPVSMAGVSAFSESRCGEATGSGDIADLTVGDKTVPMGYPPNKVIYLTGNGPNGARLVLNEQILTEGPGGDRVLTVNAAHLIIPKSLLTPRQDVIVASATSDIHGCL